LARQYQVSLTPDFAASDAADVFGLGSYANVSQSEALNSNAFHRLKAGITLGGGIQLDPVSEGKTIDVTVMHIPSRRALFSVVARPLSAALQLAMAEPGGPARTQPSPPIVKVHEEAWQARTAAGGVIADNLSAFQAFQAGRAAGGMAVPATETALNMAGV
jgi:hypothetical protein